MGIGACLYTHFTEDTKMKYLLFLLAILIASTAIAGPTSLPNDSSKLTVSVYAENDAQVNAIFAASPELHKYVKGAHYKVYKPNDPMFAHRFKMVETGTAIVQANDGTVIWANRRCPWRKDKTKDETPKDEDTVVDDEEATPPSDPAPVEDGPNPWVVAGIVLAGLVVGAGSKFVEELRS